MNLYEHSGKIGFAPVLLPIAGIPLLLILAAIYGYINVYNPIGGYVTILIILGFAAACGFTVSILLKLGKCRNRTFCFLAAAAAAFLSLYFAWAFFLYALLNRLEFTQIGLLGLILNPLAMWEVITEINKTGWFTIKGGTPSGIFLWFLWGIEAVIILAVVTIIGSFAIDDKMFCEKCGVWGKESETKTFKVPPALASAKASDINVLTLPILEPAENETVRPAIQADLIKCPTCNFAGRKYKLVSTEIDSDGNEKDNTDSISGIVMV